MPDVATSSAPASNGSKSKASVTTKPEKPDEEQYKKDAEIAQKELDKAQERLVRPSPDNFFFAVQDDSVANVV